MPVHNAKPIAQINKGEAIAFLIAGTIISGSIIAIMTVKRQYSYFNLLVLAFAALWLALLWVRCCKRVAVLKRHSETMGLPPS